MVQRPPPPSLRLRHPRSYVRSVRGAAAAAATLLLTGCDGPQSALAPAGRDAERVADLFLWMSVAFAIVWAAVVALAVLVTRWPGLGDGRGARWLIIGGGVVLPVVVLTALLVFGVAALPGMLAAGEAGQPVIEITGRQWWWRVRYLEPGQPPVELANEIRLPVGRRLDTRLASDDVVHSFWVPALAGKMDMLPGRINHLALEPTRTGVFRGACAEFCGLSHARMHLHAVVVEAAEFESWLRAQRQPARPPADAVGTRGAEVFASRGCPACHTIRGTEAPGTLGPDLTHVGSRLAVAAGVLPMGADTLKQWITGTDTLKPGVHMPAFLAMDDAAATDLAAYLAQLQ